MENRKLIICLFCCFLGSAASYALAYNTDTHALLTQEIANLYNSESHIPIEDSLVPFLVDGSRKEDEVPRWMNHFYDPIYQRGLSSPILGSWPTSTQWANDEILQGKAQYRITATIASILTALQEKRISALSTESAFTWDKALKYWIWGEREKAIFTLGHVLHLIEDVGVPDHTRNDEHAGGSPYEEWASRYTPQTPDPSLARNNKEYPLYPSLENYFDELANYSNKNFYSKDTMGIQSGYSSPTPDFFIKILGRNYAAKKIGGQDHLISLIKSTKGSIIAYKEDISIEDEVVLSDYWQLLSAKTVKTGAGVLDLFFKEVERLKDDPAFTQKRESFLGQITKTAQSALKNLKNSWDKLFGSGFQTVTTIPLEPLSPPSTQENPQQNVSPPKTQNTNTVMPPAVSNISAPKDTLTVSRVIDGDTIVLTNGEIVRYIGINAPELSDTTSQNHCFALRAKKQNEAFVLNKAVLLQKGPEEKDTYGRLLRYVWIGDDLINAKLIESGAVYAFDFGHPHELSNEFKQLEQSARKRRVGLWGECVEQEPKKETENKITPTTTSCPFESTKISPQRTLVINEIAWMGNQNSSNDEWIEIKNISSQKVSLDGWRLINQSGSLSMILDENKNSLSPGALMILERTDDQSAPSVAADGIYSGALSNAGDYLKLISPSCEVSDSVDARDGWPAGDNNTKQTMERSPTLTWHHSILGNGTPKKENSSGPLSIAGGGGGNTPQNNNQETEELNSNEPIPTLRINEIMYNPPGSDDGSEWVEIYNTGTSTADLLQLKLIENGTRHSITSTQGTTLDTGKYGVIADDAAIFLSVYPSYTGTLFDSSFSLSNSGEELALEYAGSRINYIAYTSDMGANGNGSSLQYIDNDWVEAPPTPGEENHKGASLVESTTPATHIVISEMQVSGTSPEDEFIELYNPTDIAQPLDELAIHYVSGKATSTENEVKKNFPSDAIISPKSFYLLAHNNGIFASRADMTYASFSLSSIQTGGHLILATDDHLSAWDDPKIIDSISYGSPVSSTYQLAPLPNGNESVERKTVIDGHCSQSTNAHEFEGNSCDRNSAEDFDIRINPKPQTALNFPEPREKPERPTIAQHAHNPEDLTISLSWNEVADFSGSTASTSYVVLYNEEEIQTIATSTSIRYKTVGTYYDTSVLSQDAEGLRSEPSQSITINIPSFVSGIYAHQESTSTPYVVDLYFTQKPYFPDPFGDPSHNAWGLIVLHLNQDPPETSRYYWQEDMPRETSTIPLLYRRCHGHESEDPYILIPDTEQKCGISGEAYNAGIDFLQTEDAHISTLSPTLQNHPLFKNEDNYLTVGFYATDGMVMSDGRMPRFALVARDITQYPIDKVPPYSEPTLSGDINTELKNELSQLHISWNSARDPDSVDTALNYQVRWTADGDWEENGAKTNASISVTPETVLEIAVRAYDSTNKYSQPLTLVWEYPQSQIYILQDHAGSWSEEFGTKNPNCYHTCPDRAALQSIEVDEATDINFVVVSVKNEKINDRATFRMALYTQTDEKPNFTQMLGETYLFNQINLQGEELTFRFPEPIHLDATTPYWLVLDVTEYSDIRGYERTSWRVATASGDPYPSGMYVSGIAAGPCDAGAPICEFIPQSTIDWYMKIGLSP